jgi:hypothetical protein
LHILREEQLIWTCQARSEQGRKTPSEFSGNV